MESIKKMMMSVDQTNGKIHVGELSPVHDIPVEPKRVYETSRWSSPAAYAPKPVSMAEDLNDQFRTAIRDAHLCDGKYIAYVTETQRCGLGFGDWDEETVFNIDSIVAV